MTISSIPPSLAAQLAPTPAGSTTTAAGSQAAPKYTPAEVVENFVASVESSAITEILGGTDSSTSGLAGLLGGSTTGTSTGTPDLASLLGGTNPTTSTSDLSSLAAAASAYDLARSAAALGVNPFDQTPPQSSVGSTVDASA